MRGGCIRLEWITVELCLLGAKRFPCALSLSVMGNKKAKLNA
jgi:hypothetical protein